MKLDDDLPQPVTRITRFIGYGVALVIILILVAFITRKGLVANTLQCMEAPGMFDDKRSALLNAQLMGVCISRKNGFLEDMMMGSVNQTLRALPNAPCKYVGVWQSFQPHCTYSIALDSIGEFTAEPVNCSIGPEAISVSWGVHKGQMVWIYKQGRPWPPEVNPMQDVDADTFMLKEANGSRTVFKRVAPLPSTLCP